MMKIDKIKTPYVERVKIVLDILENKYSYLFVNKDYAGFWEYEKLTNCSIFTFRNDLLKMWKDDLICRIRVSGCAGTSRKWLGGSCTGTYNYQYVSKNNYVLEHYRKILGDDYGKYTK